MTGNVTGKIKEFLIRIARTYQVGVWNCDSLAKHFKLDKSNFVFNEAHQTIYVPYKSYDNIYLALLAGTFFFINRKRMVRGLPVPLDYNVDSTTDKSINRIIQENPAIPIEKEIIIPGIPLRLFKVANKICCATRYYPLILPDTRPHIAHEALEYLHSRYIHLFDLLQEGYVIYLNYVDPVYDHSKIKTVYLTSATTSQGLFLPQEIIKNIAQRIKIPLIEQFSALSGVPNSVNDWIKECDYFIEQLKIINKPALLIKIIIPLTESQNDQIFIRVKNPEIVEIQNRLTHPQEFIKRIEEKIRVQLPDNTDFSTFNNILEFEISDSFNSQTYHFIRHFNSKSL